MAAAKITDLTALTTIATGDLFVTVDISDTTMGVDGTNKKITWGELMGAPGAIGGTTPAPGLFTTLDASGLVRSYIGSFGGIGGVTLSESIIYIQSIATISRNTGTGELTLSTNAGNITLASATSTVTIGSTANLVNEASNTLAMRNGTNAQAFKIYASYTDASNYSRFAFASDASNYYFTSEKNGTGTYRKFVFGGLGLDFELSGVGAMWKIAATSPGTLSSQVAGSTIAIKSGSNAKAGTFTLSGGAATVSNTSVTANSVVQFTIKTSSGTPDGSTHVSATSVGTSFTVAGNAGDNSTYNYVILEVN